MANQILSFTGKSIDDESDALKKKALYHDLALDSQVQVKNELSGNLSKIELSKYKVNENVDLNAIFNSLRNIFTWQPGERILLPEFGSKLHMLLYEGITQYTEEAIASEIRECASIWEPRISIQAIHNVSTIDDTEDNTIHLEVLFTIPSLEDGKTYSYRI